jgi:TPR repeat protein
LNVALLAACTPPAAPTTAQITVVQPGIEAERRGNYGFALFTYRYWARFRVALAQYRLARLYEHGLGIDRDDAEAARWYRAASEIGYPPAHAALARLYEEGRGVPQDDAAAFDLYQKAAADLYQEAADGGDIDIHYRMGRLLERGRGKAADPSGAASHYRIAADAGNADAALALITRLVTDRFLECTFIKLFSRNAIVFELNKTSRKKGLS